jgi:hypothetical protein
MRMEVVGSYKKESSLRSCRGTEETHEKAQLV